MKQSLIPIMTSNATPNGICSSSSVYMNREAFRAFDNNLDTMWTNNYASGEQAWISYAFQTETVSNEIIIVHDNIGTINWNKIDLYGDGNLLCTILKTEGVVVDNKYTKFDKIFDNKNKYKEYKLVFNTTSYTYISEIQLYKNTVSKYLIQDKNLSLYTFNGNDIIKSPSQILDESNFRINGFENVVSITEEKWNNIFSDKTDTRLLMWTEDITKTEVKAKCNINPIKPIDMLQKQFNTVDILKMKEK